jgi:outer membrane protein
MTGRNLAHLVPIWVALIAVAAPPAAADEPTSLTVEQAVDRGRQAQPALRLAADNVQAAHERIGEAFSAFLPQLSATALTEPNTANFVANPGLLKLINTGVNNGAPGCLGPNGTVTPCLPNKSPGENDIAYNYVSIQFQLNQNIWDFGRTLNAVRQAKASEESTKDDLGTARHTVDLNVRAAFYTALADQQLVDVAREQVADLKKHTALAQARREVGLAARTEVSLADANEQNAVVALFTAQNNFDVAKVALNQAMGIPSNDINYRLVPTPLELTAKIPTVDDGVAQALKRRPDYLSAIEKIVAQQRLVDAQKDNLLPSLSSGSANGTAPGSGPSDEVGWTGNVTPGFPNANPALTYNWQLAVILTVPIYTGGLDFHKIAEYQATLDGLVASRDTIALQVRLDVQTAVLTALQSKASLDAAQAAVRSGEDALALAEGQYQVGVGSVVTLDDAQLIAVTAKAGLIQADYTYETALAKLKYALGED